MTSPVGARIELVPGGPANTWLVGDDDEVIVIDPGTAGPVFDAVGERAILAVICSHGHVGHVAGAREVADRDEALIALHPLDRPAWREVHSDDPDIEMEDAGRFDVAGVSLEVVHAPGHSRGSVLLYCEELDAAFTGDVVGAGGPVPRTDGFPDWGRQLDAIGAHVLTLPPQTRLLTGHGDELTVATADKSFSSWYSAGPDRRDAGEA
jgi:glyoxylase-like metal-dependent hydrolase (beta-lactamase superfamily II)